MSAIVVVKSSNRISLLSDRAIYEADGRVVILDRKVHAVASWTGAIHGRGNVGGILIAMQIAESFGSFDEFITGSAAVLEGHYLAALNAGHLTGQVMIEVHAAGWSEARNRPRPMSSTRMRSPRREAGFSNGWRASTRPSSARRCRH